MEQRQHSCNVGFPVDMSTCFGTSNLLWRTQIYILFSRSTTANPVMRSTEFLCYSHYFPAFPPYFFLPTVKGRYLCLIICWIWRFIVTMNSTHQYRSRMGQKTGTSKIGKKVAAKPMNMDFMLEYQNLNSGSRRTKGLNSSSAFEGRMGPSCSEGT